MGVTTNFSIDVAAKSVPIFEGYGLMKEFLVEKWFRDAKVLQMQHEVKNTV